MSKVQTCVICRKLIQYATADGRCEACVGIEKYELGDQIAYIPTHANGDIEHPDVEFGFVTSVNEKIGVVFCRYWRKDLSELRTKMNSEATPVENIVRHRSVIPQRVEEMLGRIEQPVHRYRL